MATTTLYMLERCTKAYQMRLEGKTFKEIGEALGVREKRAKEIYQMYYEIYGDDTARDSKWVM